MTPAVIDEISRLARAPRVVAIGETGLDYYYDNSPRPSQQDAFRQFIALARQLRLPLVVHLRDAYDDAVTILREERAAEVGGVIHCFSGDLRRGARLPRSRISTSRSAASSRSRTPTNCAPWRA